MPHKAACVCRACQLRERMKASVITRARNVGKARPQPIRPEDDPTLLLNILKDDEPGDWIPNPALSGGTTLQLDRMTPAARAGADVRVLDPTPVRSTLLVVDAGPRIVTLPED